MSDPSLPLQKAIIDALKAASGVTSIVSQRIYDEVPEKVSPAFPYITLGPLQVLPDKADCIDGTEAFPQIDAWSRRIGFPEIKQIGAAIIAALDDQPPVVAGFTCVIFEIQSVNYLRDPDGETRHAALTFHALLQTA